MFFSSEGREQFGQMLQNWSFFCRKSLRLLGLSAIQKYAHFCKNPVFPEENAGLTAGWFWVGLDAQDSNDTEVL